VLEVGEVGVVCHFLHVVGSGDAVDLEEDVADGVVQAEEGGKMMVGGGRGVRAQF